MPGVRLNLGRRGTSVSVGVRGAHVTVGPRGVRKTVGIPGTGMSYTTSESWETRPDGDPSAPKPLAPRPNEQGSSAAVGWIVAGVLFVVLMLVLLGR